MGRCAESLGQASRNRIESRAQVACAQVELDRGIEYPRAVEVRRETAPLGQRQRIGNPPVRNDLAADRVLQREQARTRVVRIVGLDRRFDFGQVQRAVRTIGQGLRLHRG